MRQILLIFIFLSFSFKSAFAYQLSGTVKDVHGEALSYASVYLKGTTYGVLTNLKGEYFMELERGTYDVMFDIIGYQTHKETIEVYESKVFNVVLHQIDEELETITISGDREDPAYPIIRKAMEKRSFYLKNLESYKCNVYIRAALEKEDEREKDTIPQELYSRTNVNLLESQSEFFYVAPNKNKEIKNAFRDLTQHSNGGVSVGFSFGGGREGSEQVSVSNPMLFFTRVNDGDFNFYKNLMDLPVLSESPYTSPLASTAFAVYRYKFLESFIEDERLVYKIQVEPKYRGGKLYSGIIYIEDVGYSLKALELDINPYSLKFFSSFKIIQNYTTIGDSITYPVRQEFYYETKEGRYVTNYGKTRVQYSNYEINVPIDPKFMSRGQIIFTDSSLDRNEAYWVKRRPISLQIIEKNFIQTQDSILAHHKSPSYINAQDSIYNNLDVWNFLLNGIVHKNRAKGMSYFFYPLIAQMQINLIDGYRHTLGGNIEKEWTRANTIDFDYEISYGFLNENIRGDVSARYMYNPKKFAKVRLRYANKYTMLAPNASVVGTFSPSNYVENQVYGIGHEMEWWNGFRVRANLDYNQFEPYKGKLLNNVWKDLPQHATPEDFDAFSEVVFDITADITIAQKYEIRPYKKVILGSKYPTFTLHYKKGINGLLNSNVDYDYIELTATDDFKWATMGLSRWKFGTGRFLNDEQVRIANLKFIRGSDRGFMWDPLSNFQQLSSRSVATSKAFFEVHYVHHFNGALLGKLPLLNKWGLQLFGGGGLLYLEENNVQHFELFGGIEKSFRIKRQLFRVSGSYVASQNNEFGIQDGFKIGIDFYNSVTRKWIY